MRVFFPQSLIDKWIESAEANIDGDVLRRGGGVFRLLSGVHFRSTEGGAVDSAQLVGRVKDVNQLATLGVEVIAESAVLGDVAYVVTQGFLGVAADTAASEETGAAPVSDEEAKLLSRFLLEKS